MKVEGERFVARSRYEVLHDGIVDAQVQYRVHHARHGDCRAGPDRNQKRTLAPAKRLAGQLLNLLDGDRDLLPQATWKRLPICMVLTTCLGCNGEARRHRKAHRGHLGELSSLASPQPTPSVFCVSKRMRPFCSRKRLK